MELRMSLNFVPLLSLFAFLLSLRTDPGRLLFGPEIYEGELALWGVLFRLFCLAAFFRFRVLWPVVAYSVIYVALGPRLGRMVELVSFGLFATFLGGYRDALIKVSAVISLFGVVYRVSVSFDTQISVAISEDS